MLFSGNTDCQCLKSSAVPLVIVRKVGQIHREIQACHELLKIAGQADIDRIPLHVDESRIRKYGVDDSDIVGVDWSLVDDAQLRRRHESPTAAGSLRLVCRAAPASSNPLRNRIRAYVVRRSKNPSPLRRRSRDARRVSARSKTCPSEAYPKRTRVCRKLEAPASDCCNHVLGIGVNHIVDEAIACPRGRSRAMTVFSRLLAASKLRKASSNSPMSS